LQIRFDGELAQIRGFELSSSQNFCCAAPLIHYRRLE